MGEGCARLGLSGNVAADDLATLLEGRAPSDGACLVAAMPSRPRRVAGFDLTFSAPKSVSVLYGLGPGGVAKAVTAAHDGAVSDALHYLERHATFARRGHAGERSIETTGLIGAAFRHRTSHAGEPQLHTHVLVANAVLGSDGRWSAPHASLLYHHGRTAGFVYQAALRAGLVELLGVQFEAGAKRDSRGEGDRPQGRRGVLDAAQAGQGAPFRTWNLLEEVGRDRRTGDSLSEEPIPDRRGRRYRELANSVVASC